MTPERQDTQPQPERNTTQGPFAQVSIVMFVGMALLAALSLIEFTFPTLKWLTFPTMIVGIVILGAIHFFHRAQAWIATFHWLRWLVERDSSKPADGDSPTPIEPE